ncbi:MAG: HD domain-containing protein [Bacteroidaceae bacterium]|nr:HD domain-containing protein [Bacteroidaceae bacterium]
MRHLDRAQLSELLSADIFHLIGNTADDMGVEAYVVGGYVRDLFLERPSKDIDVVCVGSGIELARAVAKRIGRRARLSVFRNFGTAQVKINMGAERSATKGDASMSGESPKNETMELEFVGARRESYSHDSRKPIVEDGTLEDDQQRRDFTINALAVCLNAGRFGELVDPFDGVWDLEDRIIATPLDPDVTFSDDPLRMMRAIRFATQLNFEIEPETFEALHRNRKRISIVSGERIADEIQKIMDSDAPSRGWELMFQCGLLDIIFPELAAMQGVEKRGGRAHKDNLWHTLEVLTNVVKAKAPLWLRWAALLHDIGKPRSKRWDPVQGWTFHNHNYIGEKMVPQIFRRLKLPLDERMKYVEKLVGLHMRPIAIADDEVTDSAVRRLLFEAGDDIDDLMLLCEADITSKNEQRKQRFLDNFQLVRQKLIDLEERDRIRNFQPPVTGDEIMARYGLQPSRPVGVLKEAVKDAILDGLIPNEHDAALAFVDKEAAKMGLIIMGS